MRTFGTLLPVAVLIAAMASSSAASLCRNKKGALFERDSCKSKETTVDPASIGLVGPPGPAGPQGPSNPNANTLNGLTAAEIVGQASGQITSGIVAFLNSAYTVTNAGTVFPGFCGCTAAFCNAGDFLTECNGAVSNNGTGYLTRINDINPEGCEVCGCTTGGLTTALAVSTTCLNT